MSRQTAKIKEKRTAPPNLLHLVQAAQNAQDASESRETQDAPQGHLLPGKITASHGEAFNVLLDNGLARRAKRAAGCMLLPEPGDTVLLFHFPQGQDWVLQVLEKASGTWQVQCPGDMELSAPNGVCGMKGRELRLEGLRTTVRFLGLDLAGKNLEARVENVRSVAGAVSMLTRLCTATVGRLIRNTGLELHKARQTHTEVAGRCSTHAEHVSLTAEEEVKIDGKPINLG